MLSRRSDSARDHAKMRDGEHCILNEVLQSTAIELTPDSLESKLSLVSWRYEIECEIERAGMNKAISEAVDG